MFEDQMLSKVQHSFAVQEEIENSNFEDNLSTLYKKIDTKELME